METDNHDDTVFPCSDVRLKIAKDPDLRNKLNAQRAQAAKHKRVTGPKADNTKDSKGIKDLRQTINEKRSRSETPAPKIQSEVHSTGDAKRHKKANNNGVALPKPPPATAPVCLLYTSPSPRDVEESRMPSSA